MKIRRIRIENMIIHKVVKNEITEDPKFKYILNDRKVELDEEQSDLLAKRIIDVSTRQVEMIKDPTVSESAFDDIVKISKKEGDFTNLSSQIAKKLSLAQTTRNISDSSIIVFNGTIYDEDANVDKNIAYIIKADFDETFELIENENMDNILRKIENAILGKEKKLYKTALFVSGNEPIVYVYDSNMSFRKTTSMAVYFHKTFLGCKVKDEHREKIKELHSEIIKYINDLDEDINEIINIRRKAKMINQVNAYFSNSEKTIVDVNEIKENCIPVEIQDNFSEKFTYNEAYNKDAIYFSKFLAKQKIVFESNITITYNISNAASLEIIKSENDYTYLKIKGKIEWK